MQHIPLEIKTVDIYADLAIEKQTITEKSKNNHDIVQNSVIVIICLGNKTQKSDKNTSWFLFSITA